MRGAGMGLRIQARTRLGQIRLHARTQSLLRRPARARRCRIARVDPTESRVELQAHLLLATTCSSSSAARPGGGRRVASRARYRSNFSSGARRARQILPRLRQFPRRRRSCFVPRRATKISPSTWRLAYERMGKLDEAKATLTRHSTPRPLRCTSPTRSPSIYLSQDQHENADQPSREAARLASRRSRNPDRLLPRPGRE